MNAVKMNVLQIAGYITEKLSTVLSIKTPQLIGIVVGCSVFSITISTVIYLLYASGSFSKLLEEFRGESLNNVRGNNRLKSAPENGVLVQFTLQPELYNNLLSARGTLPVRPKLPVLISPIVKLNTYYSSDSKVTEALLQASNGSALFGESQYDVKRLWGWLTLNFLTTVLDSGSFSSKSFDRSGVDPEIKSKQATVSAPATVTGGTCHPDKLVAEQCFNHLYHDRNAKDEGVVKPNFCHVVITDKELEKPIGMFSLVDNDPENLSIRIDNIWLTPAFQGTNRVYSAMDLLIGWLVDCCYRRIVVHVDERHLIARKFLLKCGFMQEALLRKHKVVYDRNCNTVVYTILNSDWPSVKLKLNGILKENAVKEKKELKHKIAGIDLYSTKLKLPSTEEELAAKAVNKKRKNKNKKKNTRK